jgi:hypothetical protein
MAGTSPAAPTPPQTKLLRLLLRLEAEGRPPTYRELAAASGWTAVGTARDHVRALARQGLVATSRQARGRRLTARGRAVAAPADTSPTVGGLAPADGLQEGLTALRPYLRRRRFAAGACSGRRGRPRGSPVPPPPSEFTESGPS